MHIMDEILQMVRTHFEAATPSLPLSHNPSPPLVDGYASGGGIFRRPPKYSIVRLCKWLIRNIALVLSAHATVPCRMRAPGRNALVMMMTVASTLGRDTRPSHRGSSPATASTVAALVWR